MPSRDCDGNPIVLGSLVTRLHSMTDEFFQVHGHGPFQVIGFRRNGNGIELDLDPGRYWITAFFRLSEPKTLSSKEKSSGFKKFQKRIKKHV